MATSFDALPRDVLRIVCTYASDGATTFVDCILIARRLSLACKALRGALAGDGVEWRRECERALYEIVHWIVVQRMGVRVTWNVRLQPHVSIVMTRSATNRRRRVKLVLTLNGDTTVASAATIAYAFWAAAGKQICAHDGSTRVVTAVDMESSSSIHMACRVRRVAASASMLHVMEICKDAASERCSDDVATAQQLDMASRVVAASIRATCGSTYVAVQRLARWHTFSAFDWSSFRTSIV